MKRFCSIFLIIMLLSMCITPTLAAEVTEIQQDVYTIDFNEAADVALGTGFSYVIRPENGVAVSEEAFVSGDGALKSGVSGNKQTITLPKTYTGKIVVEADFRVESIHTNSPNTAGKYKFLNLNNGGYLFGNNGFSSTTNYTTRYVYQPSNQMGTGGPSLKVQDWNHVKIVVDSDANDTQGSISWYVNGEVLKENALSENLKDFGLKTITIYNDEADGAFLIDNLQVYSLVEASDKAELTSTVYTVSDSAISGIAEGSTLADILADITVSDFAAVSVTDSQGVKRTGYLQTGDVLTVTSQDGTNKKSFTLQVTVPKSYDFRESFDTPLGTNVTLGTFSQTDENGDAYMADGSKNGILKSDPASVTPAVVAFDQAYDGKVTFTAKFKVDYDSAVNNGRVMLFEVFDSTGKTLIWYQYSPYDADNFKVRPVYFTLPKESHNTDAKGEKISYGEWHTAKIVTDPETGTYSVWVDDQELATGCYPYNSSQEKVGDLASVKFYHRDAKTHTKAFYIDEIRVTKTPTVTYTVGENGSLNRDTTPVSETEYLEKGMYSYRAVPAEGHQVKSVTVNGTVIVDPTKAFTVTVSGDTAIVAEFEKIPATEPAITTGTLLPAGDAINGYTPYMVYATITNPDGITGYGMTLSDSVNSLELPGFTKAENEIAWNSMIAADGKFAFRVYGAGLKKGINYTLTPYIQVEGNKITGSASEEFEGSAE